MSQKNFGFTIYQNCYNGTVITLVAEGSDEVEAVQTLKELVDSKFGEGSDGFSNFGITEKRMVSEEYVHS